MSSPPQRWYCACGANNPPNRAACFRCGAAQAATRKSAGARLKRRTPKWAAALPIGLATLFLLSVLYRVGTDAASPILAKQTGASANVEALPARPEAVPAAPSALTALPPPPKPAPPAPAALPPRHAPELPDAPSMLTAPQAPPQVTMAPVLRAPTMPEPPAAPAPSMMAAAVRPAPPQPPVTSAPMRPADAPGVTNAQGWTETPIQQERPVVRINNTAGDEGRSQVFLSDGRARFRVQIRNPYGEVTLAPGSYRYELYVAGSPVAPDPDQVGVLRCRKFTQYSLDYFRAPFNRTRRQDLGDERPDGS